MSVSDLSRGLRATSHPLAAFIDRLREGMRSRPEAQVVVKEDTVTVLRLLPHGPDVTAIIQNERYTLVIGGWHNDLPSLTAMLAYEDGNRGRSSRAGRQDGWQSLAIHAGAAPSESHVVRGRFEHVPSPGFLSRRKSTSYLQNE